MSAMRCHAYINKRNRRKFLLFVFLVLLVFGLKYMFDRYLDGTFDRLRTRAFEDYDYPLEINANEVLQNVREGRGNIVQPINEVYFQYLKKPVCPKEVTLLIIVRSAPENLHHRAVLRRTWADSRRKKYAVAVIYHTGLTLNHTISSLIDEESSQFHDILQSDFYDHYYNITYKSIMGLKYACVYCKQAKFILYVDDDYYVSIPNAVSFLEERQKHNSSRLWTGYVSFHTIADRGHGKYAGKSTLTLEEYPYDYLPPFVHGGAYMMSSDVVRDFYLISKFTKYLKLDDVFLGAVGKRLNITPYQNGTLFSRPFQDPLAVDDPRLRDVIASHRVGNIEEAEFIWRKYSF